MTKKRPVGRPDKYKQSYCKAIKEYFAVPAVIKKKVQKISRTGELVESEYEAANEFPTVAGFAASIGVAKSTLWEWKQKYPEFSTALERAKAYQEDILIKNAINNRYAPAFSGLFAKNNLGWAEQNKNDHTSSDGSMTPTYTALLDELTNDKD